jgi:hypothetical protein
MTLITKVETVFDGTQAMAMINVAATEYTYFSVVVGGDPDGPKDCGIYYCDWSGDTYVRCVDKIFAGKEEALAIADAIYKLYEDPK